MFTSRFLNKHTIKKIYGASQKQSSSAPESLTATTLCDGVKKITMCHGKTRNSLSIAMMKSLVSHIEEDENNPILRVIVLTAEGPVFSAGHNLKELSKESGLETHKQVFTLASKLMNKIIDCPVPVIARVDGVAAAAGCQLVAQCDIAVCTEKSTFSTPGANFGIFCSTPGVALARSVPKSTALKMLLTGLSISSEDALTSGLVTKVASDGQMLDEEIEAICQAIKGKSRSVIELGKKFYYKQVERDVKTAYELGGEKMVENLQTEDGREGICSFIEKRKPVWKN